MKPASHTAEPVLYTPLRVEQAALRGAARSMRLVRTGMSPRRAAAAAAALADPVSPTSPVSLTDSSDAAGSCGAAAHRRVEVPSAPLLADALRQLGLTVHVGPILSSHRILRGIARQRVAATHGGPLAVDMESAALAPAGALAGAAVRTATGATSNACSATATCVPFAVVRVIVDSVDHPLWRVGTPLRGVRALRTLRACLPALEWWAAAMTATDRRNATEEEVI